MNRGCVDCHDGPFFSELYERQPEAEQLPIHYTLERALLPLSRSDALVANLRQARETLLKNLAATVATIPDAKARSGKIAIELEELRHSTYGRRAEMESRVSDFLKVTFSQNTTVEKEVTTLLFNYEKSLVRRMGNRTFFTEDERVAMAEALGGPVLVEKMAIPPNQIATRRKLPIRGPLATEGYAFYDAGFYALGVSLPRYDRGNGGSHSLLSPVERALLAAMERALSEAASVQAGDPKAKMFYENREAALEAYKTYQALGDVQAATDRLEATPNVTDEMNAARTRFKAMIKEEQKSGGSGSSRVTGAPGSAYTFQRDWNTQRYQSKGDSPRLDILENVPQPEVAKPRATSLKPVCDHDLGQREATVDTSWDRDDIPQGEATDDVPGLARRSSYYFLSRARQMVFDEEHWGYRKPLLHDNELAFWGAFKTPTLRNVELTAPYMYNGRFNTLMEVVEFYENDEQQNNRLPQLPRDRTSNTDKHPAIDGIDLTIDDKRALVFFLLCLTDDRVSHEKGPFDHPSIRIVNGYKSVNGSFEEEHIDVNPVGASGTVGNPSPTFPSDH